LSTRSAAPSGRACGEFPSPGLQDVTLDAKVVRANIGNLGPELAADRCAAFLQRTAIRLDGRSRRSLLWRLLRYPRRHGIVVILDEFDQAAKSDGIGTFLKELSERLASRRCINVQLTAVALPDYEDALRKDHESPARILQPVKLEWLTKPECLDLVDRALASVGGQTESQARDELAWLSSGRPDHVHKLGSAAVARDIDNIISYDDLEAALGVMFDAETLRLMHAMWRKTGALGTQRS